MKRKPKITKAAKTKPRSNANMCQYMVGRPIC